MKEIHNEQCAADGHYSEGYCESICIYRAIARQLYLYDAFVFHASVVSVDGEAYAFAAKSGVGKSTHTRYWMETFGERACVINGDKPVIRYMDGVFYACGTPWKGKENWGCQKLAPLKGCSFLERGEKNDIRSAQNREIMQRLFHQVLLPENEPEMSLFINLMGRFLKEIPFYILECTMQREAAETAYRRMHV